MIVLLMLEALRAIPVVLSEVMLVVAIFTHLLLRLVMHSGVNLQVVVSAVVFERILGFRDSVGIIVEVVLTPLLTILVPYSVSLVEAFEGIVELLIAIVIIIVIVVLILASIGLIIIVILVIRVVLIIALSFVLVVLLIFVIIQIISILRVFLDKVIVVVSIGAIILISVIR
jgi:hypothetical protein